MCTFYKPAIFLCGGALATKPIKSQWLRKICVIQIGRILTAHPHFNQTLTQSDEINPTKQVGARNLQIWINRRKTRNGNSWTNESIGYPNKQNNFVDGQHYGRNHGAHPISDSLPGRSVDRKVDRVLHLGRGEGPSETGSHIACGTKEHRRFNSIEWLKLRPNNTGYHAASDSEYEPTSTVCVQMETRE